MVALWINSAPSENPPSANRDSFRSCRSSVREPPPLGVMVDADRAERFRDAIGGDVVMVGPMPRW